MKKLLWIMVLVGCGKKGGDSDHFPGWKPADAKAALQGAWVGPDTENLINRAAYEITGDTVKVTNSKGEKTYKLEMDVPCQFGLKQPDGTTYHMGMVMKDGKLTWGGGDMGYRNGDHAVMCAGLTTWTVEKGVCFEKSLSGRWKEEKGKCGFKKEGDKEVFFWTWVDKESSRAMAGDLLEISKDEEAQKVADYAAAKAALPAK